MKKTIFMALLIALTAVFTLFMASCSGKTINSAEALKKYLDSRPANSPDKPIKVTIKPNDIMRLKISTVINDAGKYVSLSFSGKALTTIVETDVTADWDSDYFPGNSGTVKYFDLNMDKTLKEEINKKTGVKEKIVVKNSESNLQPRLVIFNDKDEGKIFYSLRNDAVIFVENGQKVNKGDTLAKNCDLLLGDSAFFLNEELISIILPKGLTRIGTIAFASCTNLARVTIPNSVTSIGDAAFRGCTSLTSIIIPNNITGIGDQAFQNCTSLSSVTIGNSVTSIGGWAFRDCTSLTSVTIPNIKEFALFT
jgi:hypothetical protein